MNQLPRCCSMHDPSGRRGIWYEVQDGTLIVKAGREGDDAQAVLRPGEVLTADTIAALVGCLDVGAWMLEDNSPTPPAHPQSSG